jgi:hypothetical protein
MDDRTAGFSARDRLVPLQDSQRPGSGMMRFLDAQDGFVAQFPYSGADGISPCFTRGTMIATARGEIAVERLAVGDKVITRDNGLQIIRWIGGRRINSDLCLTHRHLAPVRIRKGALGNDLPERDMMVSPNHRMLVANDKTALHFEDTEVLVAAKHLTGLAGVNVVYDVQTAYLHLMFDCHEVILSDGAWSESFQPDAQTLAGIGNAQRLEILELFPELSTPEGLRGYGTARRTVRWGEVVSLR